MGFAYEMLGFEKKKSNNEKFRILKVNEKMHERT